jgi:hypothetical protein
MRGIRESGRIFAIPNVIHAELAPGAHAGAAINDRLRRAAAKG